MNRIQIECDREIVDELHEKILSLDSDASIAADNKRNFSGAVETLAIIASMSSIAANAFLLYVEAKKKKGINIQATQLSDKQESR